MKALSINQPWAWAICHAGKDVENRDWSTRFRGPFLIHAGLKIDRSAWDEIAEISGQRPPDDLPTGGIVGQATILGCGEAFDDECPEGSPWFFGRYGFSLCDQKALPFRPCKGALGFFTPDYNSRYKKDTPKENGPDLFSLA